MFGFNGLSLKKKKIMEKSKCPNWEIFLDDILSKSEKAKIKIAVKSIDTCLPVRLIFYGVGPSGKSLTERIINDALDLPDNGFILTSNDLNNCRDHANCPCLIVYFDRYIPQLRRNPNLYQLLATELPAIKEWLIN